MFGLEEGRFWVCGIWYLDYLGLYILYIKENVVVKDKFINNWFNFFFLFYVFIVCWNI